MVGSDDVGAVVVVVKVVVAVGGDVGCKDTNADIDDGNMDVGVDVGADVFCLSSDFFQRASDLSPTSSSFPASLTCLIS